ncbi:MAG: hypothetical protein IPK26_18565 [Planctomycetes bacterium]|nr:hypothetical protein [Planctomycetota bacterium]
MKRVLAFLLLVAIGSLLVWWAAGDEQPVDAKGGGDGAAVESPPRQAPQPGVVPVKQGTTEIGIAVSGALELRAPGRRERVGDRVLEHRAYELRCRDSRPLGDGRQQLDDADMLIFDRGRPAARLTAKTALVELGRDQNGSPSLRQDKHVQLRDAVLAAEPGARSGPFRLEGGQIRARLADDAIVLETERPTDPVTLVVGGERPASMRGLGLEARMTRDSDGAVVQVEIAILQQPRIEAQAIAVAAQGRMLWVEQVRAGTALLTVDRDVLVTMRSGAAMAGKALAAATVRGDHLSGWLRRERLAAPTPGERARESATWRLLRIEGQPVRVQAEGLDLATQRLTVVPGSSGQPWLFAAGGASNTLTQTDPRTGRAATFSTSRRLHLVLPGERIGAAMASFGFPRSALRPLYDTRIAVFAGETQADVGDGTSLTASRGLHVFKTEGSEALAARGFGIVHVERAAAGNDEQLVLDGNDGLWLLRGAGGETLRLGPPDLAAANSATHQYVLQHGDLRVTGSGVCRLERDPAGRSFAHLRAPTPAITVRSGTDPFELTNVDRLDLRTDGKRIDDLTAGGPPLRVAAARDDWRLTAAATEIRKIGPHAWRLQPATAIGAVAVDPEHVLPGLDFMRRRQDGSAESVALRAPGIEIHAVGHRLALLDAIGSTAAAVSLRGTVQRDPGAPVSKIAATAARVRFVPFAITPLALAAHGAGLPRGLAMVVHRTAALPWLLADQVQELQIEDSDHGVITGHGERLVVAAGADAGLVAGDPESLRPAEVRRRGAGGREVVAHGARVRFQRAEERLVVLPTFPGRSNFLIPDVELRGGGASSSAWTDLRAHCRGEIEVLPDAVAFRGPVTAQGLLPDGSADPAGLQIATEQLELRRNARTGEVQRLLATGDVRLDWPRIRARCRELEIDLAWQRCIVRDPIGAEVWLPDGQYFRSRHLEANYTTLSVDSYDGRFEQRPAVAEKVR